MTSCTCFVYKDFVAQSFLQDPILISWTQSLFSLPGGFPLLPCKSRQISACVLKPWYFCLRLEPLWNDCVVTGHCKKWVSSCSLVTSSQKVFQNVDVVSRVIFQASKRKPTSTVTIERQPSGATQQNQSCFLSAMPRTALLFRCC